MKLWLAVVICCIAAHPAAAQNPAAPGADYSGMYSFIKDGEFVQITVEEKGKVTGFISRFGDSGSDAGVFMNQFFKSGKLDNEKLTFTTESVHGSWFEFDGIVARGPAKTQNEEGYYVLRGKLTRFNSDADKKVTSQPSQVELKSFPRDAATN